MSTKVEELRELFRIQIEETYNGEGSFFPYARERLTRDFNGLLEAALQEEYERGKQSACRPTHRWRDDDFILDGVQQQYCTECLAERAKP
jgi:hypothetical protein